MSILKSSAPSNSADDLIQSTALDLVASLKNEALSPHDLLDALENRIDEVDHCINALPTLCFERARITADQLMRLPINKRGILCGLPVSIKDLNDVKGVRTTMGSSVFANHTSVESDYMVGQLEKEGAIVYAKSNTPEFGAGGNTFNEVFGATRNPWDLRMSVAGSSGGAAASLSSGTSWLAQGSDNAGSLRSPASFCSIVGMRPSFGRVAMGPSATPFESMSVNGPMARNVEDLALLLDAMAAEDFRDPFSLLKPETSFLKIAQTRKKPLKVAFSQDLGITPVEAEIAEICKRAALKFEEMGIVVEEKCPDFSGVHESYQTLRAKDFAVSLGDLNRAQPNKLKPEIIGNIEQGLNLSLDEIAKAELKRGQLRNRAVNFFDDYDLLLCPTSIVAPYPVDNRYVSSCTGVNFENYIDWLAIVYAITLVSLPALSLPCGYTKSGLPVGLQMIARPRGDAELLSYALKLEESLSLDLKPIDPIKKRLGNG